MYLYRNMEMDMETDVEMVKDMDTDTGLPEEKVPCSKQRGSWIVLTPSPSLKVLD